LYGFNPQYVYGDEVMHIPGTVPAAGVITNKEQIYDIKPSGNKIRTHCSRNRCTWD
jgi:hypothetical protein